jgi:hypothetical protein
MRIRGGCPRSPGGCNCGTGTSPGDRLRQRGFEIRSLENAIPLYYCKNAEVLTSCPCVNPCFGRKFHKWALQGSNLKPGVFRPHGVRMASMLLLLDCQRLAPTPAWVLRGSRVGLACPIIRQIYGRFLPGHLGYRILDAGPEASSSGRQRRRATVNVSDGDDASFGHCVGGSLL